MTGTTGVWPWLPWDAVQQLLEDHPWDDVPALHRWAEEMGGRHPRRRPPRRAPGPVDEDAVLRLRRRLVTEFASELDAGRLMPGTRARDARTEFDARVGRLLTAEMGITPAEGAAPPLWGWFSTVLAPDLVALRWPVSAKGERPHGDRVHGGNRNTFRRPWLRRRVLGPLLDEGNPPLGEDELVNIFERSRMARDHRLTRILTETILSSTAPNRSAFTRDLVRIVRRQTGPRVLEVLDEEAMRSLVERVADSLATPEPTPTNGSRGVEDVVVAVLVDLAGPDRDWVPGARLLSTLRTGAGLRRKPVIAALRRLVQAGQVTARRPLGEGVKSNHFRPNPLDGPT